MSTLATPPTAFAGPVPPAADMSIATQDLLTAAFDAHRNEIEAVMLRAAMENVDRSRYDERDIAQVIRGALGLWDEALHETGTATRQRYLQSVVPGLVGHGTPLSIIIGKSVEIWCVATGELLRHVPAAQQAECNIFIGHMVGHWHAELAACVVRASIEGSR